MKIRWQYDRNLFTWKDSLYIETYPSSPGNCSGRKDWLLSKMAVMQRLSGLVLDILKVESWTQMGRTANMIIKYSIHVFASICKKMHILLMGRRYRER